MPWFPRSLPAQAIDSRQAIPQLEELEIRAVPAGTTPDATLLVAAQGIVVADFPGVGVFSRQTTNVTFTTGWVQRSTKDATVLAIGGAPGTPMVVAGIPGLGVFLYNKANNFTGQPITTATATQLAVDGAGTIYGVFPGYGVQQFISGTTWMPLTVSGAGDPSLLAAGGLATPVLVAEFPGYGVQLFLTAKQWQQLTPANATLLAVDGKGNVVGQFPGAGVWSISAAIAKATPGTSWTQLLPLNATALAVDVNGNLIAEFQNEGVWQFNSKGGWLELTPSNASLVALDDTNAIGEFLGSGVQIDPGITPNSWAPLVP